MRNSQTQTGASASLADLPIALAGRPAQDRELFLLDGDNVADLRGQVAYLAEISPDMTPDSFGALAAALPANLAGRRLRAAVVAASAEQAATRFADLLSALDHGALDHGALGQENGPMLDTAGGIFLGQGTSAPRIGFLFPGQGGSNKPVHDSALARRFEPVRDLFRTVTLPVSQDPTATSVAQPRIALGSSAGLRALSLLGIEGHAAVGHSLGELVALHWAGAMTEAELVTLATARGQVMAEASEGNGAMAGINAGPQEVEPLLAGEPVVIACYNGPTQTVISGPAEAVERVRGLATARGVKTARVPVSHAFHSPAVEPAARGLDEYLSARTLRPLARTVVSTLTGDVLPADANLRQLLVRQLREPVKFSQALRRMAAQVDLLIEVGPGRVLSSLAAKVSPRTPVIPLSTDAASLAGPVNAVAAAYVLGVQVRHEPLFADRFAPRQARS